MRVNAAGMEPTDIQTMCFEARIAMTLVHFDRTVLDIIIAESGGGMPVIGQEARAGARMGNNVPLFSPSGTVNPATGLATTGNHFIRVGIVSPVGNKPWRFWYCKLSRPPIMFPLGNERSAVVLNWRAIPYTQDPYGGGSGMAGVTVFDYQVDS